MNRAVILIGVHKAKTLPTLQAVFDGVRGMKEWALSQGISEDRIKTITDETQKVNAQQIYDAIEELSAPRDLEQLIIYFAGHGVNLRRGEYWLLSDAVVNGNAAINVEASVELARFGTIPHVVFLSDACRTAANGIQAQGITGTTIFPNQPVAGPEKFVDIFFATLLGEPSLEIADPDEAASKFRALYTETLLEALRGQHPEMAEPDGQSELRLIRPWPLKKYLAKELPMRVFQATRGSDPRHQQPDARITSDPDDPDIWLSAVAAPPVVATPPFKFGPGGSKRAQDHAERAQHEFARPQEATRAILANDRINIDDMLRGVRGIDGLESTVGSGALDLFTRQNQQFADNSRVQAQPFGPMGMESKCGFKLRGASLAACEGNHARFDLENETTVRVFLDHDQNPCASVLLKLTSGHGVLLPAIKNFLASLTFDGPNLVDVAYEPAVNSDRWFDYQNRATELRTLRAVIAASTRLGTFRLEGDDAEQLARRMQVAKGIDPSLALYAAHAYRERGLRQRIREMAEFMRHDLNICLFDIAMLAGLLSDPNADNSQNFPFLPMLSQSWSLMAAYQVVLPPPLENIVRHVSTDSLWTLFDAEGVELISRVIQEGGVR